MGIEKGDQLIMGKLSFDEFKKLGVVKIVAGKVVVDLEKAKEPKKKFKNKSFNRMLKKKEIK